MVTGSPASTSHDHTVQTPTQTSQVERLLSGRTRHIRLTGTLRGQFETRFFPQTAKIIRSWMLWVALLDVTTLVLNALLLPAATVHLMLAPASLLVPAAVINIWAWRRPRAPWILGSCLIGGMFLILLSVALVGVRAGGEYYERHLNIMLFVAISAIIIFSVRLSWTIAIAVLALVLYLVFQVRNPGLAGGSAVAATLFFASGIAATLVARRTMTLLAQKTFLLELRDKSRVSELADANARLQLLARTDALTGIANRRFMAEILDLLWNSPPTAHGAMAMLMCDIDHFKRLNDSLGHAEGDRCLVKVAGIIQSSIRRNIDHVARYGGEEFLVVLPNMGETEAVTVAQRIRSSVEAASLANPRSPVAPFVTLSIGVAVRAKGACPLPPEQLQKQADIALYRAKQKGRNQVMLYQADMEPVSDTLGN